MNGSRPSSSQGPLRAVQDGRIVEEAWGEGAICTRKEKRNIWGVSSFLQGKGMEGFSSFRLLLLSMGNGEGPCDR